ncbi:MAG: undecaprenyldiphospho-muramoylpentapeptide beta-N-acetylglucosaminyltransferase [Gemmatimonadetes bacterium]|nr:undecaprenyldiphospho-muramoylpentapeptide beta-N-acetylglucosaminyltransferase [Gemmatimonadota bacterium]
MTTVLFAGGGTGGHLMPALAIAEEMVGLDPSVEPYFVGSLRGVESGVLPRRRWRYELLPLQPLRRVKWWSNVGLPWSLYRSLRRIRRILTREDPRLVVGTGGYVAGPVVWAGIARGLPGVVQEQNARPGLATRWLARRARQVHLGFPEARRHLNPGRGTEVFVTGNPIRPPPEPRMPRGEAKRSLGFSAERPLVLAVGGSQGALAINEAVRDALADGAWPEDAQLMWQTGAGSHAAFTAHAAPGRISVEAFIDPIERVYAGADVVVSRAGAMTLAELAGWGLPAILIPLPGAAAGHQLENARTVARAGAAVLLEQRTASGRRLGAVARELLGDPARMADMAAAARNRARPEAARQIAAKALELVAQK